MNWKKYAAGLPWLAALAASSLAQTALTIEGVADKTVYKDRVTFRVPAWDGYDYDVRLNGEAVPTDVGCLVDTVDYHELAVRRTTLTTGAQTNRLIRFIVRASARGNTEWGLPPWTPYPWVSSATNEFAGARLRVVAPAEYPADMAAPLAVFVETPAGDPVRVNGWLAAPGQASIPVRRGVGSGSLRAAARDGQASYEPRLASLTASKTIRWRTNEAWTIAGGTLPGSLVWNTNSRIELVRNIIIPKGVTLTIEPGVVVKLGPQVNIQLAGTLEIRGTPGQPVVLAPANPAQAWGGIITTSAAPARITAQWVFMTGSGGVSDWFKNTTYSVHRAEQALLLLDGAQATLDDCFLLDGQGQVGHGHNSTIRLNRCLAQKFITGGEYVGCTFQMDRSAFLEFPRDDDGFDDGDNDGLYFTEGTYTLQNSLVGWAKDDCVDAGSGGAGSVTVSNCWFEAAYHEGLAWSGGGRSTTTRQSVVINCGQGIECGWSTGANSPLCQVDGCLSLGNLVGARFGDNYDWSYNGFLRVTNSFLLANYRDVWGLAWDNWTDHGSKMDIQGNFLGRNDAHHTNNSTWQPAADGGRLAAFFSMATNGPAGLGFAVRQSQFPLHQGTNPIPVGLSHFATRKVSARYLVETPQAVLAEGQVEFQPGETIKILKWPGGTAGQNVIRFSLSNPADGELSGISRIYFIQPEASGLKLSWTRFADEQLVYWNDADCQLEQAPAVLGPWVDASSNRSPVALEPGSGSWFYRLRKTP